MQLSTILINRIISKSAPLINLIIPHLVSLLSAKSLRRAYVSTSTQRPDVRLDDILAAGESDSASAIPRAH